MRKYKKLEVDVVAVEQALKLACEEAMLEDVRRHPLYAKLHQKFKVLGAAKAYRFIEFADCLADITPPDWGFDNICKKVLRSKKHKCGVDIQFVFNFLESRHNDENACQAIIDYLVFCGKTRHEAEHLLQDLHNYLRERLVEAQ
jgi:hypothetical protein